MVCIQAQGVGLHVHVADGVGTFGTDVNLHACYVLSARAE